MNLRQSNVMILVSPRSEIVRFLRFANCMSLALYLRTDIVDLYEFTPKVPTYSIFFICMTWPC
jgi:hypothetical protein